jgi:tetratricopeptide (TPR) repeat protein
MTADFRNRARLFHEAIRRALLKEWDPIGVSGIAQAQDEYDSYVPTIYKMLISRKPRHEVFDYLWWLETEHMALTGNRRATEGFVDRLMQIPDEIERAAIPDPSNLATKYDSNALERRAQELIDSGRSHDAIKIYLFMADGDPSLDAGYLGMKLGECYERIGDLHAAKYWYGRCVEENPAVRTSCKEARDRLKGVNIDDLT